MTTLEGGVSSHSSSPNIYAPARFIQPSNHTSRPAQVRQQQQQQPSVTGYHHHRQGGAESSASPARSQPSVPFTVSGRGTAVDTSSARKRFLGDANERIDVHRYADPGLRQTSIRRPSISPPRHPYARPDAAMPGQSSHTVSPPRGGRTLPPFHSLHDEEEDAAMSKRRRLDDARDEAEYRQREARRAEEYDMDGASDVAADRMSGNASSAMSDRRPMGGDDGYDANVPLARRRGDAAHAKASRLHIDTGYGTDAGSSHSGGNAGGGVIGSAGGVRSSEHPPRQHSSSQSPHNNISHGVKSAPPYKATFFDREREHVGGGGGGAGAHYDPRGAGLELPAFTSSRGAHGGQSHGHPQYYAGASARYGRHEAAADGHPHDAAYEPHEYSGGVPRREGMPPSSALPAHSYRSQQAKGGPPTGGAAPGAAGTPLTGNRMGFVPQTATLPSPAYHTTQFFRNGNGGSGAPGAGNGNGANGGGSSAQQPPRTAGLNPPMTARLPEHLRSPPSSKTQFLSLFSSFYDSLQDSRTLKATLEDQVRRSNTLLQTLQRSARVLELTVERRLTAERSLWESKVQALEERCRRLERTTGAGSPTPAPAEEEVQEGATAKEAEEKGDQVEATVADKEMQDAEQDGEEGEAIDGGKEALKN